MGGGGVGGYLLLASHDVDEIPLKRRKSSIQQKTKPQKMYYYISFIQIPVEISKNCILFTKFTIFMYAEYCMLNNGISLR